MNKFVLYFTALLIYAFNAMAGGYHYQKLDEMIPEVDSIILAKVIALAPPNIEVDVVEILAGKVNAKKVNFTYILPAIWDEDGSTYWYEIPGSGIEVMLETNKQYILLMKSDDTSFLRFSLLRAESIDQRDFVLGVWNKYHQKKSEGHRK